MAITNISNETGNVIALFGTETFPGVAVTPTAQLLGTYTSSKSAAIRRTETMTGGLDRGINLRKERASYSGNYTEPLTYQSLPAIMQYAVKGNVSGVSDAETVPGYTYTFSPTFDADDIETMTVVHGVDGRLFQDTGVRFNEWTISADHTSTDNTWDFSGPLFLKETKRHPGGVQFTATGGSTSTAVDSTQSWTVNQWVGAYVYQDYGTHIGEVRRVLSNTADTLTFEAPVLSQAVAAADVLYISALSPVIAIPDYDQIEAEGTEIFVDLYNASASSLGTTDVSDRVLSWNVNQTLSITPKFRASGQIARVGRGARWITGTVRFEADRWDEYMEWEEGSRVSIRIQKEGPIIDADEGTTHMARIDVEKAVWDVPTDDTDNSNMTLSLTFVAELVPGDPIMEILAKTDVATLP